MLRPLSVSRGLFFDQIKEKNKKWLEMEIINITLSLTVKKAKTKIREVDIVPKVKGEDK